MPALACAQAAAYRQCRHGDEQQVGSARHRKGDGTGPKKAQACGGPEQHQCAQCRALQGIHARPVAGGGQQKTHCDGCNESPEHFMGVPEDPGHHALQQRGGKHPERYRHHGPEGATQVQRPKPQFQKGHQGRALRRFRRGRFLDFQKASHCSFFNKYKTCIQGRCF